MTPYMLQRWTTWYENVVHRDVEARDRSSPPSWCPLVLGWGSTSPIGQHPLDRTQGTKLLQRTLIGVSNACFKTML